MGMVQFMWSSHIALVIPFCKHSFVNKFSQCIHLILYIQSSFSSAIYDKLVECFVKNCGKRSDMTSEAIQAAMDELADLAFNGLMRKRKQLIFTSDEISTEVNFIICKT